MNKIATLLLSIIFFGGCAKKEYLDPIQLPVVVTNEVFRTDKFSENELFAASSAGIYLQFGNHDYVEYNWTDIGKSFTSSEIRLADVHYASETLFIRYGEDCIVITRSGHQVFKHGFFIRPTTTIAKDGTPIIVGFGDIIDPTGNGDLVYLIYIERIKGNNIERIATNMQVPKETFNSFGASFTDDGNLIIASNPIYIVSDWSSSAANFTAYQPSIATSYGGIFSPRKNGNVVLGYYNQPTANNPVTIYYSFDLNSRQVSNINAQGVCSFPSSSFQLVKHLDWENSISYNYVSTNLGFVSIGEPLIYIQKINLELGTCELLPIVSTELLQSTFTIKDIGFHHSSNKVLISTASGLLSYNLDTKQCTKFIDEILEIY